MSEKPKTKEELIAKGHEMRRFLVGDVMADKLDANVYTDPHMQKFGDMFNELVTMISDVSTDAHDALGLHVRFCRIHGWSEDEIIEMLIHLTAYIGIPKIRKAILIASKTFQEMRDNNELPADAK